MQITKSKGYCKVNNLIINIKLKITGWLLETCLININDKTSDAKTLTIILSNNKGNFITVH